MGMGEDTYSAPISTASRDSGSVNQESGMVTDGTHSILNQVGHVLLVAYDLLILNL